MIASMIVRVNLIPLKTIYAMKQFQILFLVIHWISALHLLMIIR